MQWTDSKLCGDGPIRLGVCCSLPLGISCRNQLGLAFLSFPILLAVFSLCCMLMTCCIGSRRDVLGGGVL